MVAWMFFFLESDGNLSLLKSIAGLLVLIVITTVTITLRYRIRTMENELKGNTLDREDLLIISVGPLTFAALYISDLVNNNPSTQIIGGFGVIAYSLAGLFALGWWRHRRKTIESTA